MRILSNNFKTKQNKKMFDKILKTIKPKFENNYDIEFISKISLLNFILSVSIALSLLFGIYHIIFDDNLNGIVMLTFSTAFILLIYFLRVSKNYRTISIITVISLGILFLWLSLTMKSENTGLLWSIAFPMVCIFLFNQKNSVIYSLSYVFILIVFFLISPKGDNIAQYTQEVKIRFLIIYLTSFVTLLLYKKMKSYTINTKEKELLEVKKKLNEKNNFISNLSFRIRTPLNNIVGILNLKSDSLEKDVINEIEFSINNLITIVNSIPEFSETKLQFLKSDLIHFNLSTAIKDSLKLYKSEDYPNLKFSLNISNKIPSHLVGNILAVKQILISIVDFYYKHNSGKNTKIDIIVTEKENQQKESSFILFKIKSNISIDIFKGFEDENSFADLKMLNNHELNVIDSLIQSIEGKLNIYYDGDTAAFLFTLPFVEANSSKEEKNTERIDPAETKENVKTYEHKKIELIDANVLLVEDDKVNQKIMVMSLRKHVASIDVAENGKEALIKFGKTKYDIILMDIRMPLMDGFKTTMKIREAEAGTNSRIPIIAVTANALSGDREKCLEAGMDEYISKPFNKKELVKKMTEQLS